MGATPLSLSLISAHYSVSGVAFGMCPQPRFTVGAWAARRPVRCPSAPCGSRWSLPSQDPVRRLGSSVMVMAVHSYSYSCGGHGLACGRSLAPTSCVSGFQSFVDVEFSLGPVRRSPQVGWIQRGRSTALCMGPGLQGGLKCPKDALSGWRPYDSPGQRGRSTALCMAP